MNYKEIAKEYLEKINNSLSERKEYSEGVLWWNPEIYTTEKELSFDGDCEFVFKENDDIDVYISTVKIDKRIDSYDFDNNVQSVFKNIFNKNGLDFEKIDFDINEVEDGYITYNMEITKLSEKEVA